MTFYRSAQVSGLKIFYREAGSPDAPTIVLLHGFPTSSHMFRDLIPHLAPYFRVIAPDYPGFGYSDMPASGEFAYTFDNLAGVINQLLFDVLKLSRFALYMHDYGAPVGFRIASRHPAAITGLILQNGNAYAEGISEAFKPLEPFWANRTAETEAAPRTLLTAATTQFQYTHGAEDVSRVSPDAWTFDQALLDRPGSDRIQLDLLHNYTSNLALYDGWHQYLRAEQPKTLIVWGKNDPFFTVAGAEAFLRDLPNAELKLLNGGHMALEEHGDAIANHIIRVFATKGGK
jgi:pimeloyl-ACP methyl ester carboxylesterase